MSLEQLATLAVAAITGYLIGSIPFPQIFVRLKLHGDLRSTPTGNVGVMNSMHLLGRPLGLAVLLSEAVKGAACAWIGLQLAGDIGGWAALVAAVAGANWSIWLRGAGGRGNTTFAGGVLVLAPLLFVLMAAIYAIARAVSGSSFIAARLQIWLMPVTFGLYGWWALGDRRAALAWAASGLAFALIFRVKHSRSTDDHLAYSVRRHEREEHDRSAG